MKIAVPKERMPGETRVATSPDVVKKFVGLGLEVVIEAGAGEDAAMTDAEFRDAGAVIAEDETAALRDADVVLKVQRPVIDGALKERFSRSSWRRRTWWGPATAGSGSPSRRSRSGPRSSATAWGPT